jgi:hypothetical protein
MPEGSLECNRKESFMGSEQNKEIVQRVFDGLWYGARRANRIKLRGVCGEVWLLDDSGVTRLR